MGQVGRVVAGTEAGIVTPQSLPFTRSFVDRVETLFRSNPWIWIDSDRLAQVGGKCGWRTRVSDCRKRGLTIDNRVRHVQRADGSRFAISEYKFEP